MRYCIEHLTDYRYTHVAVSTQQTLRLSPRIEAHQRVLGWRIRVPGTLSAASDAYGNPTHMHTLHSKHDRVRIEVQGEVELDALNDGRLAERGELPPQVFVAVTPLTVADERLADFSRRQLKRSTAAGVLEFAQAVRASIEYQAGTTHVRTTAAQALALSRGVCQDHAHVFIAGCRAAGIPARYVSGYYYSERHATQVASHAWADAWVSDGWTSIYITHTCFASDALCRLAIGRDYDSASPVRGVRAGGGEEAMKVALSVRRVAQTAQGAPDARPEEVTA
jgi:transglutaminase-like putative cysteine protease